MIVFLPIEVKNTVFTTFQTPVTPPAINALVAISIRIDTFRNSFSHVNRIYNYYVKTNRVRTTCRPNNR